MLKPNLSVKSRRDSAVRSSYFCKNYIVLTYYSWYTDKQSKDVCDAVVEEIKASGSQHSANEIKCNLCTLCTVYLSLLCFSILFASSTKVVYWCYDGKRRSWTDMRPSRQAQV